MTLIKFCGMRREEDVSVAGELAVDAVGFVLWPGSPRFVAPDRLEALVRRVPAAVTPVGVFVRPSRDELTRAIDAGIRVAQVHGMAENPLNGKACETWFATVLVDDGIEPDVSDDYIVLLDALDRARHGGTGRTIDWTLAARVAATRRVMLAGGLTPSNVGEAIRVVRPYGVDVASGIEETPGVKDARAMRAFVAAVREVPQ